ncbi:hypothetical protein BPAE_0026g00160 [Botrytis paeoniae]|uniref:Uncharacterized protein n=1 Tax=Botrytis paeoniae TaxID=278948 RepID=A0A4Z1FUZ3_9HELO|nr:hypothetical protein BPAE_0026g00160 [Botrytis paeoniae]
MFISSSHLWKEKQTALLIKKHTIPSTGLSLFVFLRKSLYFDQDSEKAAAVYGPQEVRGLQGCHGR